MAENLILNLGSGSRKVPDYLVGKVLTVDLDGNPDVKADARDLPFEDDYADAIYASHLLEHFDEYEIQSVLAEWKRVLKPGGQLVIEVPDIQTVAERIAKDGVDTILYRAVAERIAKDGVDAILYRAANGAHIRGQDVVFGWSGMTKDSPLMRHKVAFDGQKLGRELTEAGFVGKVEQYPQIFALLATVKKPVSSP